MNRPEWSDVTRYKDARDRAQGIVDQIQSAGFTVVPEENGYSVRLTIADPSYADRSKTIPGRQVGIFTVSVNGIFWWGWVEHTAGNGRTEFSTFPEFFRHLKQQHRSTR